MSEKSETVDYQHAFKYFALQNYTHELKVKEAASLIG
jgi:hypothetical protein